jgi:hypothetical protein
MDTEYGIRYWCWAYYIIMPKVTTYMATSNFKDAEILVKAVQGMNAVRRRIELGEGRQKSVQALAMAAEWFLKKELLVGAISADAEQTLVEAKAVSVAKLGDTRVVTDYFDNPDTAQEWRTAVGKVESVFKNRLGPVATKLISLTTSKNTLCVKETYERCVQVLSNKDDMKAFASCAELICAEDIGVLEQPAVGDSMQLRVQFVKRIISLITSACQAMSLPASQRASPPSSHAARLPASLRGCQPASQPASSGGADPREAHHRLQGPAAQAPGRCRRNRDLREGDLL